MPAMIVLWHEQLRDNIDDTSLIRTEVGGELRTVELTSLAVLLVKYCLACTTERSRLACFEQTFEVVQRWSILVEVDRDTRTRITESDLDIVDRGCVSF